MTMYNQYNMEFVTALTYVIYFELKDNDNLLGTLFKFKKLACNLHFILTLKNLR